MRYLKILCVLAVALSLTVQASASPFNLSGEWKMNADGWTYKMVLIEKGEQLDGILQPLNHPSSDIQLTGRVYDDGKVELFFVLAGVEQRYTGYISRGGEKYNAIAGTAQQGNRQSAWFAERSVQTAQPPNQAGTPYPAPPSNPATAKVKMFSAATMPMTGNEKAERFEAETIFEKTPRYITASFSGEITLLPGQKLLLAGNADGTADWRAAGFLFIEFRSENSVRRFVIGGGLDRIKYDGHLVERIGSRGSNHPPADIDLAPYLPQNTPLRIKAHALHYGPGIGSVSDIYLLAK